jgi:hypothetical protein
MTGRMMIRMVAVSLLMIITSAVFSQKTFIYGRVVDENSRPFDPAVNIAVVGSTKGTTTRRDGSYHLDIPPGKTVVVRYSFAGLKPVDKPVNLKAGDSLKINVRLTERNFLDTFEVVSSRRYDGLIRVDKRKLELLPTASGDYVTEFIKRMPGVSSRNELSTQYSVRGGNFDENLVYVNGIEVHRPVLIRSGQQEGLPFVNSDLVKDIAFSAGGFNAGYGDKMSSVLDITYKKPVKFAGALRASLMGGSVYIEDASKDLRFRYLLGVRYKTNSYLLSSLDTKGEYKPSFTDVQTLFSYDLNEFWELSFLGNFSVNKYHMIPADRETNFGNIFEALRFKVYFEGQEVDKFQSLMGAAKIKYQKGHLKSFFAVSAYKTVEQETFDIMGQYWLDVLENDLGKDGFGEVAFNKGVGTFLNHGRNRLDGSITSLKYDASYKKSWSWGAGYRHDIIDDRLSEWQMIDSAGFSIPHPQDNVGNSIPGYVRPNRIELQDVVKADNKNFITNRVTAYLQKSWVQTTKNKTEINYMLGGRFLYWDYSKEAVFNPRGNITVTPKWDNRYSFRLAGGLYYQPGFYREMRYFDGSLNPDIKMQKSWQVVLGSDYTFYAWERPFKFVAEVYYKRLWDLIPYEVNDVRIRYYAENNARGYATGLDLKLNGEFVKNAESWVGISLMQTQEDIEGDYYYEYYNKDGEKIIPGITFDNVAVDSQRFEPGFIPRPTDQRFSFNLFFQDYVPGYPSFKVHLNLVYASGLPFGPPTHNRYQQTRRYPPYRRVDIGFSKQLIGEKTKFGSKNPLRHFKSMWVSVEVFNLLQISNTVSYIWVMDVEGRLNGVPNYLTPRRVNVQFSVKF